MITFYFIKKKKCECYTTCHKIPPKDKKENVTGKLKMTACSRKTTPDNAPLSMFKLHYNEVKILEYSAYEKVSFVHIFPTS